MNEFQWWCKKILPIVQAAADGELIQVRNNDDWLTKTSKNFDHIYDYRINPRTIMIGDIEVPEPMREAPADGDFVWFVSPGRREGCFHEEWIGYGDQYTKLERGFMQRSKDGAEAQLRAMITLTAKK